MATDHLRAAITKHLVPLLGPAGFHRRPPKMFVRVRGEIVHAIGFQLSQWGGQAFYLHQSACLVSDPQMLPDVYRVGSRIDDGGDGVTWHGPDAASADAALQSVARVVQSRVLPWLDGIATVRDFIAEYVAMPTTSLQSLELAVALLRMDATDRPHHVCTTLSSPNGYLREPTERDRQQMAYADQVLAAIEQGQHQALLDAWREENIAKHGLGPAVMVEPSRGS